MSSLSSGPRRARSEPPRFRKGRVPRKWRHRLEPRVTRERRPRGLPGLWTRARRVLWSWMLWAALGVLAISLDSWGWAIGAGAVSLVAYLIGPREYPPTFGLDHDTTVGSPEFLPSLTGLTGSNVVGGNAIAVLNNGDEFYPAMLEAIRGAQFSITIEAYIYWQGEVGTTFANALAERARAGVAVKILLDAVGSSTIGSEILETLEGGGCQLAWFNPIRAYSLGRFNDRTHRKSLIVDGVVGFTGGAGIADQWSGCAQDADHWRDMQVRIEGPGAVVLQTGFAQNWLQTTRELVSGPLYFPEPEVCGDVALHGLLSSPSTGASAARILYYFAIICARRSIYISNPYFVPDQTAIDALVDARRRGVDVRVVVSGRRNDNWLARQNSMRLFGALLEHGIAVFEYHRTMLHQKTMIVDGGWATIGTTNFDNRSFAFNEESNVSSTDPDFVAALTRAYQADERASEAMTLEAWRRRGWWSRIQETVASLMQDQV
ncbi:MAG: phospholipase D-like domain-containing protein [Vicinamibacterales bacterium]